MTLDEAIEHTKEVSEECEGKCSKEHKQLYEWLCELRFYRRQVNREETKWMMQ